LQKIQLQVVFNHGLVRIVGFGPRSFAGWEVFLIDAYLTDARWALVDSLLPGKLGDPGCHGRDNRLFLEAVLWISRTGAPWRDLPPEFGKWYTAYTRYRRWVKKGVWTRVFAALAQDPSCEYGLVDDAINWRSLQFVAPGGVNVAAELAASSTCGREETFSSAAA
jgi:transposase